MAELHTVEGAGGDATSINGVGVDNTNLSDNYILVYNAATGNLEYEASGAAPPVDSVFGRTGVVVAANNDYTWAQIDKTTSDIADIATRSHTSLTDIGTNTHAQLDTHVAATAAHGVSGAIVGTTDSQTLTNKTLTTPTLTLRPNTNPTAEGQIEWHTTSNNIRIGDGITTRTFSDDTVVLDRANHTGTQTAATISDFDTEVSNNASVAANTAHVSSDGSSHTFIDQDVTSGSSPTLDGTNFTGISAWGVSISDIGAATYDTLQEYIQVQGSTGAVSGGVISDAGGGNINVGSGQGFIRSTDSAIGLIYAITWAASNGNAIPAGTTRYIGVEYNGGSPQVVIKTSDSWNKHSEIRLGHVTNVSGTLHIMQCSENVANGVQAIMHLLRDVHGLRRADALGGLILGETGTRNVTLTAGEMYCMASTFAISAIDTSVADTFASYYGTTLQDASATQWDNQNYDNSGVLTAMTTNWYSNLWFYVESDGDLVMVYGTSQYSSLAGAETDTPPSTLPGQLSGHSLLVGRIIFQKGASSAAEIQSAFATTFSATAAATHNNLASLQGGTAGEYYHLTSAEYSGLVTTTNSVTLTNKTITSPVLTLTQSTTPTPTAEGRVEWDTDNNRFAVGDGSGTVTFSNDTTNATTFAPLSQGVTNGNSHDHSGGDGSQIDHTTLSNGGTATHADLEKASFGIVIDGGGSAITTGIKGDVVVPFDCTITSYDVLADQSGSIVIDLWKDTYANFAPTDADSITASAPVTISTATKATDSTLTGWTTTVSAGDIIRFNVDSASTVTRVTLSVKVSKT